MFYLETTIREKQKTALWWSDKIFIRVLRKPTNAPLPPLPTNVQLVWHLRQYQTIWQTIRGLSFAAMILVLSGVQKSTSKRWHLTIQSVFSPRLASLDIFCIIQWKKALLQINMNWNRYVVPFKSCSSYFLIEIAIFSKKLIVWRKKSVCFCFQHCEMVHE